MQPLSLLAWSELTVLAKKSTKKRLFSLCVRIIFITFVAKTDGRRSAKNMAGTKQKSALTGSAAAAVWWRNRVPQRWGEKKDEKMAGGVCNCCFFVVTSQRIIAFSVNGGIL